MDRTVPAPAAKLLQFIASVETSRNPPECYKVIYGHNQGSLSKPLTSMTIDEVLVAGPSWANRFGSSACGAYQFMAGKNHTLQGLKAELGLRGSQVFDASLQDRLGYHLLRRRGYDEFMEGKLSVIAFAKRLAQEWASLPVLLETQGAHRKVTRGQSYYAGDGINKSLVKPEQVERLLAGMRSDPAPIIPDVPPPDVPPPVLKPPAKPAVGVGVGAALGALITAIAAAAAKWFGWI